MLRSKLFLVVVALLASSVTLAFESEDSGNLKTLKRRVPRGDSGETTSPAAQDPGITADAPPAVPSSSLGSPAQDSYVPVGLGPAGKVGTLDEPVGEKCESGYLSHKGGSYGPRAQMLIAEIKASPMADRFLKLPIKGIDEVCPGFENFADDENKRLNFWVAVFTRLAYYESTCNAYKFGTCKDQRLCGGDFQIPETDAHRYWRLPRQYRSSSYWLERDRFGCRSDFRNPPPLAWWSATPRNNIACAVEIMGGTMCGMYTANEESCKESESPFFSPGYWQPVNRGFVADRMKKFPLCKGVGK